MYSKCNSLFVPNVFILILKNDFRSAEIIILRKNQYDIKSNNVMHLSFFKVIGTLRIS